MVTLPFFRPLPRVLALTLLVATLSPSFALDLNQNGASDVYDSLYPAQAGQTFSSLSDTDGDGFTDLQEVAFGTDWRENNSHPLTMLTPNGSVLDFSWYGVKGVRYQVLNTELLSMNTSWLPVGGVQVGANQTISIQVSAAGLDKTFWRLSTKEPLDEDSDFMNSYEESMLGTSDGSKDSDTDGNSDAQEFQQGTNAADAQSNYLPTIVKIYGDNQGGAVSTISGMPLVVAVTGSQSLPLFQVPVTYTITSGSGALIPDRSNPTPVQSVTLYSDEQGQIGSFFQFPATEPVESQITATIHAGTQSNSVTFTTTSAPSPNNDFFAQARSLNSEVSPFQQTNAGATLEAAEPVHGDTLQGTSVWFTWTAPTSERIELRTDGSNFDTVLAVYTGSTIGQLTEVASNDDQTEIDPLPFESKVVFQAVQGTTYHIAIAGFAGATGNISLAWASNSGPVNDFFADAQEMTGDTGTITASNTGATLQTLEPHHNGEIHSGSIWYKFNTTQSGTMNVNTADTSFNSVLAVYTGPSVGNLTPVAATTHTGTTPSQVNFPASSNTSYWIAVAGLGTLTGNLSTSWTYQGNNDLFVDATTITGDSGTIAGTNVEATSENNEPLHWYACAASIWYSWVAPASGDYAFDTIGSDFDSVIAVYTGNAVDSLTQITADDESGGNGAARVQFAAVQGTT